jgi:hypothetical protein
MGGVLNVEWCLLSGDRCLADMLTKILVASGSGTQEEAAAIEQCMLHARLVVY